MSLSRFILVALLLCCVSCGIPEPRPAAPPAELPGGFKFREMVDVPMAEVQERGAQSASRRRYEGSASLTVTIFQMKSDASAFELVQKSRPQPGTLFFQAGSRYVLLAAPGLDQRQLNEIAKALEKELR